MPAFFPKISRHIFTKIVTVHFHPVDVEVATKSVDLPGDFHKDPADRMIVAPVRKLAVTTGDER